VNNRKWMQLLTVLLITSILLIGAVQRFDTIQAKKIIVTGSGGLVLGASSGALDINGKQLILDADADSSLTADTDDQLDLELGGSDEYVFTAAVFDISEGTLSRIDLDADNDTSIRSSTEDQIDFELGGSDVYSMTASNLYLDDNILTFNANQNISLQSPISGVLTITLPLAANRLDIATGNLKVGDGTPTFTQDGEDLYVEGALEMATDMILGAQTSFSVTTGIPITPTGRYQPIVSIAQIAAGGTSDIAAGTTVGEMLMLHNINATQIITVDGTGLSVECKTDIVLRGGDILTLIWNGTDWNCVSNYDNS